MTTEQKLTEIKNLIEGNKNFQKGNTNSDYVSEDGREIIRASTLMKIEEILES